jgi:hypothetical protein
MVLKWVRLDQFVRQIAEIPQVDFLMRGCELCKEDFSFLKLALGEAVTSHEDYDFAAIF